MRSTRFAQAACLVALVVLPTRFAAGQGAAPDGPDDALVRRVLAEADAAVEGQTFAIRAGTTLSLARALDLLGDEEGARARLRALTRWAADAPPPAAKPEDPPAPDSPWSWAFRLRMVAQLQVELGDRDGARQTWALVARILDRDLGEWDAGLAAECTRDLVAFDAPDEAKRLARRVEAWFERVDLKAAGSSNAVLSAAKARTAIGDLGGAFDLADRMAPIPRDERQPQGLLAAAIEGIALGADFPDNPAAVAAFDRVLDRVDAVEPAEDRDSPLGAIAVGLARAGRLDRALEIARRIGHVPTGGLSLDSRRVYALCDIAEARQAAGDVDAARRILRDAHEQALAVPEDAGRLSVLAQVAARLIDAGDLDGARDCLDALPPETYGRSDLLIALADARRRGADFEAADATLRRGLVDAAAEGAAEIRKTYRAELATIQMHALLGDFAAARAATKVLANPNVRAGGAVRIARAQAAAGDGEAAYAWLATLQLEPARRASALTALLDGLAEHAQAAR